VQVSAGHVARAVLMVTLDSVTAASLGMAVRSAAGRQRRGPLKPEGRIARLRGVRVHASTGYNRAEGNRRASRNGRVGSSPTRNPQRYDSQLVRRCSCTL
jgi:hypothetical protein